jgi:hypothetical protein
MDLVDVLFTICWLFSLILFFLGGIAFQAAQAGKAKMALIQEGKALISELLKGAGGEPQN